MIVCIKCGNAICEESKITKKGFIICNNCKAVLFVSPDAKSATTNSIKHKKPVAKSNGKYKSNKKLNKRNLNKQRIKQGKINTKKG